ncbi:MAG: hypothetical protein ACJ77M_17935, partial [Thermoleophilaceae bacterium]
RDRISKELRKAGDREAADRVRALRKPSVPAWAVNQLARRHPDNVEALLAAGEEARSAQEQVLGGGDRDLLAAAVQAERDAVDSLVQKARGILAEEGRKPSAQVVDRVRGTLHAVSTDERVRELVRAGRLVTDAEPAGFGAVPAGAIAAAPSRARGKRAKPDAAAARKHKEELAAARRDVRSAEQRAGRAARRLEEAEAELEEARAEAEGAEAELRDRRDALARLEEHSG